MLDTFLFFLGLLIMGSVLVFIVRHYYKYRFYKSNYHRHDDIRVRNPFTERQRRLYFRQFRYNSRKYSFKD
jgi:hypothetical protein